MGVNRLDGKIALVTGASSGIGRASALRLAQEGAMVAVTARRVERLTQLVSQIERSGGRAVAIEADLRHESDRRGIVDTTVRRLEGLDVLVNAAGILSFGTIEDTTLDDWHRIFEVNVVAAFRMMQLALPQIILRKGSIVNISSVNGVRSFAGILACNVGKSALDQLTRCAALELASKNVRVNSVNPGVVVTELHRRAGVDEEAYGTFLERCRTSHPIRGAGNPEDVAAVVAFLASDEASWITGETSSPTAAGT